MKRTIPPLIAVVFALFPLAANAEEPIDVSIIRLVAAPTMYQGKLVRIVGFLHVGFEDNGIYPYKEDFHQSLFMNGLWLELSGNKALATKLNNTYVVAVGTFDAMQTGHLGLWSGSLTNIQHLAPWNARREIP